MDNIIAEVFVPSCSQTFDFSLPAQRAVGLLIPDMIRSLQINGFVTPLEEEKTVLCCVDTGVLLDNTASLAAQSIRDGASLILI